MDAQSFHNSILNQLARSKHVLFGKNDGYTPGSDKLANFRKAANLQGITVMQAIHGMRAKHTVSVYDMVESGRVYPLDIWTEKITDDINYLLLLKAAVDEEADDLAKQEQEQHSLFPEHELGRSDG